MEPDARDDQWAADPQIFLAGAPASVAEVCRALISEGFRVVTSEATLPGRAPWSAGLRYAIEASALVIGMLDPPKNVAQTFYELGLAEGLGKSVVLVVSQDTKLPVDLQGHIVVRPGRDVVEAVRFAVRQWKSRSRHAPGVSVPPRWPLREDQPIGAAADDLLVSLHRFEHEPEPGLSFEALVRDAIAMSAEVVVEPSAQQSDRMFDIAVWSDALTGSTGNPLLVEVKQQLPSPANLRRLFGTLDSHLRSTTAGSVLLVYGGPTAPSSVFSEAPQSVLLVSADRLLGALREQSFSAVVEALLRERRSTG